MFDVLFGGTFSDVYSGLPEPIKEGPVEIRFERSRGKIRVTYIIDFGETDLDPHKAATVLKEIVGILRLGLGVSLSRCK